MAKLANLGIAVEYTSAFKKRWLYHAELSDCTIDVGKQNVNAGKLYYTYFCFKPLIKGKYIYGKSRYFVHKTCAFA